MRLTGQVMMRFGELRDLGRGWAAFGLLLGCFWTNQPHFLKLEPPPASPQGGLRVRGGMLRSSHRIPSSLLRFPLRRLLLPKIRTLPVNLFSSESPYPSGSKISGKPYDLQQTSFSENITRATPEQIHSLRKASSESKLDRARHLRTKRTDYQKRPVLSPLPRRGRFDVKL